MTLTLTHSHITALRDGADACDLLASIDEGENTNVHRLLAIAMKLRQLAEAARPAFLNEEVGGSLVDDAQTQLQRRKDARDVYFACMSLSTLYQHEDEDIQVAVARLQNWLDEQPNYIQELLA